MGEVHALQIGVLQVGRHASWRVVERGSATLPGMGRHRPVPGNVMVERLFVYGSLAPGRPNAHMLADVAGSWEPATLRGALVQEGWGATPGYPAIVPSESAGAVEGLVFASAHLPEHWQRLDEFEGDNYVRVLAPVRLQSGGTVEAYVYAAARTPDAASRGS